MEDDSKEKARKICEKYQLFKENEDIDKIIAFVNSKTIETEWEHKQILKLDEMRKKLMERRLM